MAAERSYTDWTTSSTTRDTMTVHVSGDEEPVWSGLYDHQGRQLYRVPERHPVGFHDFHHMRQQRGKD